MTQYNSIAPEDMSNEKAAFETRFRNALMRVNTCLPVIVESVDGGGVSPVGTLTCRIALFQIDQKGDAVENVAIIDVPYMRLQGGSHAVIIDPKPGDIGFCLFSQRDISAFKRIRKQTIPGTRRVMNLGDAIYIGGFLNGTPKQYILLNDEGITLFSTTKISLNAPVVEINAAVSSVINSPVISMNGAFTQGGGSYGGNASMKGTMTITNDVIANGISLTNHVHGGVQSGNSTTGTAQ